MSLTRSNPEESRARCGVKVAKIPVATRSSVMLPITSAEFLSSMRGHNLHNWTLSGLLYGEIYNCVEYVDYEQRLQSRRIKSKTML